MVFMNKNLLFHRLVTSLYISSYRMVSILRFRKLRYMEPVKCSSLGFQPQSIVSTVENEKRKQKKQCKEWRCMDYYFWMIGYLCTTWWLLCFLYSFFPGFQVPESPGVRLSREGVTALHPVVLVPGIVTSGLELWEGRPCAEDLFRKRLWGGSFTEILKRCVCVSSSYS